MNVPTPRHRDVVWELDLAHPLDRFRLVERRRSLTLRRSDVRVDLRGVDPRGAEQRPDVLVMLF